MNNTEIHKYSLKLLKIKAYFINEIRNKLLEKYKESEVDKEIKILIREGYLNDKLLLDMKIYQKIHINLWSKKKIINYFYDQGLSYNLIIQEINKHNNSVFEKNKEIIKSRLRKKNKSDQYINDYLIKKGYNDIDI